MAGQVSVVGAVRSANRVWTGWPLEVCAPMLVLDVAVWAIDQTLQATLAKSLYTALLGIVAAVCLFMQEWLSVVVLRVGFLRGAGEQSPIVWGEVLGWTQLKRTVAWLYLRYALWAFAALIALVLVWSLGIAGWFLAHHRVLAGSQHVSHPTLRWVFLQLWILSTYVFLSRYQFVLPLVAIEGVARKDVIRDAVRLAKAHWGTVVWVSLLEGIVLMVPDSAVVHFLRPVLQPIRFAYGGLQLVVTVVSALLASWFVLVKLDLAKQALRLRDEGGSSWTELLAVEE